jgi:hypothetical protein
MGGRIFAMDLADILQWAAVGLPALQGSLVTVMSLVKPESTRVKVAWGIATIIIGICVSLVVFA